MLESCPVIEIGQEVEYKELIDFDNVQVFWTSADNQTRCITKLTDGHIVNLIGFLQRAGCIIASIIIECENERRATNSYPESFQDLLLKYSKNPETWRMRVVINIDNPN